MAPGSEPVIFSLAGILFFVLFQRKPSHVMTLQSGHMTYVTNICVVGHARQNVMTFIIPYITADCQSSIMQYIL